MTNEGSVRARNWLAPTRRDSRPDSVGRAVRGMDAAVGAPMDGFTASFGARPDRERLAAPVANRILASRRLRPGCTRIPCANVLSHLNFSPLIETG